MALGIWGGVSGLGRRHRPARRRRCRQRHLLALDLLDQRARRAGPDSAGAHPPERVPRTEPDHLDLRGLALAGLGPAGHHLRRHPRTGAGLDERHDPRPRCRRRRAFLVGLRGVGVARPARRCCRCTSSARGPSRPPTRCRSRCSSASFGSIFLLAQFFQTAQGYSPLHAGLRTLPWTGMPMFVAPLAGVLSDRIGSRAADGHRAGAAGGRDGVARASIITPDVAYAQLGRPVHPGRRRAWRSCSRPSANAVLGARPPAGGRSGFRRHQRHPRARRRDGRGRARLGVQRQRLLRLAARLHHGLTAALPVAVAVLAVGALVALLLPRIRPGAAHTEPAEAALDSLSEGVPVAS